MQTLSRRFMPLRTAANKASTSFGRAREGAPFAKLAKSFAATNPRIFDADIPDTSSASGSLVPPPITENSSKSYDFSGSGWLTYLPILDWNSCTLSLPATITTRFTPSSVSKRATAKGDTASRLSITLTLGKKRRRNRTFSRWGRGFFWASCVKLGYSRTSRMPCLRAICTAFSTIFS